MEVSISIIRSAKRWRSTTMRVVNSGEVELRAPQKAGNSTLIEFISSNGKFLAKSLTVPKMAILPKNLKSGDSLNIFGRMYQLNIVSGIKSSLQLNEGTGVLHIIKRGSVLSRVQFYKFITSLLEAYIFPRVTELAPQLSNHITFKKVRTKLVRSLWGSCTRTGHLSFNKRLIHYPTPIIDYVIIHELAHLQQQNHSKAFWDLVREHFPDVKSARAVLKKRIFG